MTETGGPLDKYIIKNFYPFLSFSSIVPHYYKSLLHSPLLLLDLQSLKTQMLIGSLETQI